MRTAIVHYWLLNRRGGEKVVEALCRLLPGADIYTLFCDPATLSPAMRAHQTDGEQIAAIAGKLRVDIPAEAAQDGLVRWA